MPPYRRSHFMAYLRDVDRRWRRRAGSRAWRAGCIASVGSSAVPPAGRLVQLRRLRTRANGYALPVPREPLRLLVDLALDPAKSDRVPQRISTKSALASCRDGEGGPRLVMPEVSPTPGTD